jgi:uncharacterized protein YlxW (UPF0749 family)
MRGLFKRQGMTLLTVLSVLLGVMMSLAIKDKAPVRAGTEEISIQRIQGLLGEQTSLSTERGALLDRVRELEAVIEEYDKLAAQESQETQELVRLKDQLRAEAGLTVVTGPGIEITLDDRDMGGMVIDPYTVGSYIVHDSDLLEVVNELRGAGALAIEINGARIIANTRISCGGPTINVGPQERFTPPFIIRAVGDPDKLAAQFDSPDSIYHLLTLFGLQFDIEKVDQIEIPAYMGKWDFTYAEPVWEGQ